jgi:hypothetical protein
MTSLRLPTGVAVVDMSVPIDGGPLSMSGTDYPFANFLLPCQIPSRFTSIPTLTQSAHSASEKSEQEKMNWTIIVGLETNLRIRYAWIFLVNKRQDAISLLETRH